MNIYAHVTPEKIEETGERFANYINFDANGIQFYQKRIPVKDIDITTFLTGNKIILQNLPARLLTQERTPT